MTTSDRLVRHLYRRGSGDITVIVDASLGGVEGYLLINELAKLAQSLYLRSIWLRLERGFMGTAH